MQASPGGRTADGTARLRRSSLGMISGRLASMALGFLFWMVAARTFPADVVGITAGTVSAMMLCTQLANLGTGPALVLALPRQRDAGPIVAAGLLVATLAAVAGAVVLLGLSTVATDDLRTAAASPFYAVLFVVMCVLGTTNIVLDHLSVAVDRGHEVLVRNLLFGVLTLAGVPLVAHLSTSTALFAPWVLGGAAACGLGVYHVRRAVPTIAFTGRRAIGDVWHMVRRGTANHLLTLAERVPALLLPVVVAARAGSDTAAYWYAAWMMAWGVQVIPVSVGISLLAESARTPDQVSARINTAVTWSLALGGAAALAVTVAASPLLGLLGADYQAAGTEPLRILVWSVVPITALQTYSSTCRSLGRFAEATVGIGVTGLAAVLAAGLAVSSSLGSAAGAWLAVQAGAALLVWWRLTVLGREREPALVLEGARA